MIRLAVLALAAIALAGCQTAGSRVDVTVAGPRVPDGLLHCLPHPAAGRVVTDRQIARHLADIAAAGHDCRSKLGAVRRILQP